MMGDYELCGDSEEAGHSVASRNWQKTMPLWYDYEFDETYDVTDYADYEMHDGLLQMIWEKKRPKMAHKK